MARRIQAHEEGAWVREAADAYARRQAEQNAPAETHLIGA